MPILNDPIKRKGNDSLNSDDYLTETAREILRPKFNSVVSDHQRTWRLSRTQTVGDEIGVAIAHLKRVLTRWLAGYADFSSAKDVVLGARISPIIDGVKERLLVTTLRDNANSYVLTLYSESRGSLTWTTYKMSPSLLFRKTKSTFSYEQLHVRSTTRDRMSFGGQGEIISARKNFGRAFRRFRELYNEERTAKV